ncbi:protein DETOXIFICATION 29-like isoform X2 [Silene latifolia]|uniref:protein DETOXIFICATION 29-like isoform X2 n=1 Tax=Silene latifolia TaxID=37657 RepID=UPI003D775940
MRNMERTLSLNLYPRVFLLHTALQIWLSNIIKNFSLEIWYYAAVIMIAGYVKNTKISVDALSISLSLVGWTTMLTLGFYTGVSVRVSNELGAGQPQAVKFAVKVFL